MFTFLRKIRKSLIESFPDQTFIKKKDSSGKPSSRASKYFMYAMGEILLVIIGILLALAINDWRKNALDRQNELFILESLKTEFEETKKQIEKNIEENEDIISTNRNLNDYRALRGLSFEANVFDSLLYNALWYSSFTMNQGTLSELLYSGRLSLLSDRELRVLLSSWGSAYEQVKLADKEGLDYMVTKNNEYFDQKISWMELSRYDRYGINFESSNEIKFDRKKLASELEFENFIYSHIWNARNKLMYMQSLLELNVKILDSIESSIMSYN